MAYSADQIRLFLFRNSLIRVYTFSKQFAAILRIITVFFLTFKLITKELVGIILKVPTTCFLSAYRKPMLTSELQDNLPFSDYWLKS